MGLMSRGDFHVKSELNRTRRSRNFYAKRTDWPDWMKIGKGQFDRLIKDGAKDMTKVNDA
jgi:hypothetical protein